MKKKYLDLVLLGKKANLYFEKLERHFEKCLAPQLITKILVVSKYPCIYVILKSAALHSHTLWLFNRCLFVSFLINFLALQKPHLFSFRLYFLWNLQEVLCLAGKNAVLQSCSWCYIFYKHSWEQKLITWKLKRKNNYDYHKGKSKYQQIYSFCIMKW